MEIYGKTSFRSDGSFFSVKDLVSEEDINDNKKERQERVNEEIRKPIKQFQDFTEGKAFKLTEEFEFFLIRDVLRYNDEEIKSLSLEQYAFALSYCVETYKRRDIVGVLAEMGKGVKKRKKGKKNELDLNFDHPEILEYIEQNTVVPEFIKLKGEK